MKRLIAGFLSLLVADTHAQSNPIKIGEIDSYSNVKARRPLATLQ